MDLQILASIIFVFLLIVFLYINRKQIKLQKIAYPLVYAYTYHAKWGIKAMDRLAKKYPKTIKFFGYAGVAVGLIGLPLISILIIKNFIDFITVKNAIAGVQMVLPIPVEGVFYVPFFYWIIAITIIAAVHEFSHGVVARVWNLKIKSTGIGVFSLLVPLVPVAFVEPDEKKIQKESLKKQLSMYAAGPFSNILLGFVLLGIALLLIPPFFNSAYEADGILMTDYERFENQTFPAEKAEMLIGDKIISIDGISTLEYENFTKYLSLKKPGDSIIVGTNTSDYEIVLAQSPRNASRGYIGVIVMPNFKVTDYAKQTYGSWLGAILWIIGLFYILIQFNIGIGLINLFPIFITDGARMLLAIVQQKFKNKKKAMQVYSFVNKAFLLMLLILIFGPLLKNVVTALLGLL